MRTNKFQPIQFQDLDDLYAVLPEDQLQMVKALRALVYECIPEAQEKLSYNVPFFRVKRTICYIWPGAVPWGHGSEGVSFGFYKGYLLGLMMELILSSWRAMALVENHLCPSFLISSWLMCVRWMKRC